MIRTIVYGVLGACIGAVAAVLLVGLFAPPSIEAVMGFAGLIVVALIGGALFAYLGVLLGNKYNSHESSARHGYSFVVMRIAGNQLAVELLAFVIIYFLLGFIGQSELLQNVLFYSLFSVAILILGAWYGVRSVVVKKYLLPSQTSSCVAGAVVGLWISLGIVVLLLIAWAQGFGTLVSLLTPISVLQTALTFGVMFVAVYYFLNRMRKN